MFALQSGMRRTSDAEIRVGEEAAHPEDVCTQVKCHVGMVSEDNFGPTGVKITPLDFKLLSYTGCFTFMKSLEVLKKLNITLWIHDIIL